MCKTCDKTCKLWVHLKSHERVHTKDIPLQYQTCGKDFKLLVDLKSHVSVHSGTIPLMCKTCDKQVAKGREEMLTKMLLLQPKGKE